MIPRFESTVLVLGSYFIPHFPTLVTSPTECGGGERDEWEWACPFLLQNTHFLQISRVNWLAKSTLGNRLLLLPTYLSVIYFVLLLCRRCCNLEFKEYHLVPYSEVCLMWRSFQDQMHEAWNTFWRFEADSKCRSDRKYFTSSDPISYETNVIQRKGLFLTSPYRRLRINQ